MIIVSNCGFDSRHRTGFDIRRPNGNGVYTLMFIKTEAFFEIDGKLIDTPPNTAILYDKNAYIHYGCHAQPYSDDWIHFDFSEGESLIEQLDLLLNHPFPLTDTTLLTEYVKIIVSKNLSSHLYKAQIIDALMHALLYSLAGQFHTSKDERLKNKYFQRLNQVRMNIQNAPHKKWDVASIAREVNLSPTHFQRLYKSFFDTTCIQDIIQSRIKNAQFYLRTTDMSIQSLSVFCGYDNELHFMRQFKKYTGMTPSEYRKMHLSIK